MSASAPPTTAAGSLSPAAGSIRQAIFASGPASIFHSPHLGFAVSVPSGWQVTTAAAPWPHGIQLRFGGRSLDVAGGDGIRFAASSQPLQPGVSIASWIDSYRASLDGDACVGADDSAYQIDGLAATTILGGCLDPTGQTGIGHGRRYDVVVVSSGRGYDFRVDGDATPADVAALIGTIHLQPASARAFAPMRVGPGSGFTVDCSGAPCMDVQVVRSASIWVGPSRDAYRVGVELRYTATGPGARIEQGDWRLSARSVRDLSGTGPRPTLSPRLGSGPIDQGTTVEGWMVWPVQWSLTRLSFEPADPSRIGSVDGLLGVVVVDAPPVP